MDTTLAIIGIAITALAAFATFLGFTFHIRPRHTWAGLMRGIRRLEPQVRQFRPEVIVAVSDGIVPAGILCTNLGITECHFVYLPILRDAHGARIVNVPTPQFSLQGKRVLVLDDHMYSGANLKAVTELVRRQTSACKSAVIFKHAQENQVINPDFFAFEVSGKIKRVPWSFSAEHFSTFRS